ncbi:hypothetical protein JOD43_001621 [Pullulanibacillus pueri]|uniref:Uncharacterized protein n=1 Tax=Pullulanibacillus pueri TaxID=1437324 RepID=A0A8J2ZUX5_9BACL|nr:hypothetical protein [Pullulanibacillus pueri]MBM7681454.1 hypothetical protein [Pullulanibacillus pueri]GGH78942.1 hypothetical protein GCM10007096_13130 [Pullulanibacillus pueri]
MVYSIRYGYPEQTQFLVIEHGKIIDCTTRHPRSECLIDFKGLRPRPGATFYAPYLLDYSRKEDRLKAYQSIMDRGGTSVIVPCYCKNVALLKANLQATRQVMKHSPLDYLIGLSTHIEFLSQALVIECNKQSIPFIQFEFSHIDDLYSYPWEWLRDAVNGQRLLFIPFYKTRGEDKKAGLQRKKFYHLWYQFADRMNIPTALAFEEDHAIPNPLTKNLGLYPIKGALVPGSDCDCVLTPVSLEQQENLHYDENNHSVVVIRGQVQKGNGNMMCPGFGQEIKVPMVHRFTGDWEC